MAFTSLFPLCSRLVALRFHKHSLFLLLLPGKGLHHTRYACLNLMEYHRSEYSRVQCHDTLNGNAADMREFSCVRIITNYLQLGAILQDMCVNVSLLEDHLTNSRPR